MAARRKSDQRRAYLWGVALHVRTSLVVGFMKQHIVEFSPINHFSVLRIFVEVRFLRFAQFAKVSGIDNWTLGVNRLQKSAHDPVFKISSAKRPSPTVN
jgi:hypothetical protein